MAQSPSPIRAAFQRVSRALDKPLVTGFLVLVLGGILVALAADWYVRATAIPSEEWTLTSLLPVKKLITCVDEKKAALSQELELHSQCTEGMGRCITSASFRTRSGDVRVMVSPGLGMNEIVVRSQKPLNSEDITVLRACATGEDV